MDNKQRHLEFVHTVINRMAGNSFLLKGWAVAMVAALFALSAKDSNRAYIFIAYFPVVIFWILDGYFLSRERSYRDLYNHIRQLDKKKIDFSMDITSYEEKGRNSWINSMLSSTLLFFYLPLVGGMIVVMYLIQ